MFVSIDVSAITLSLSGSLDLNDVVVWKDLVIEDLKVVSGRDSFRLLYKETRSWASEAIFRIRGRRMAIEAAMMPVPGSAVAQIVALTAVALVHQWWSAEIKNRGKDILLRPTPW